MLLKRVARMPERGSPQAQGPSRTCNEGMEEEKKKGWFTLREGRGGKGGCQANLQWRTPTPKPHTLKPKPSTLNPKPACLHPSQPEILTDGRTPAGMDALHSLCFSTAVQDRAWPTETKVECGTSQSKSGTCVNLSNGGNPHAAAPLDPKLWKTGLQLGRSQDVCKGGSPVPCRGRTVRNW